MRPLVENAEFGVRLFDYSSSSSINWTPSMRKIHFKSFSFITLHKNTWKISCSLHQNHSFSRKKILFWVCCLKVWSVSTAWRIRCILTIVKTSLARLQDKFVLKNECWTLVSGFALFVSFLCFLLLLFLISSKFILIFYLLKFNSICKMHMHTQQV